MAIGFLSLLIVLPACDRPGCQNTNVVFDRFTPGSVEYRAELAKQIRLKGEDNLDYWYDRYLVQNGKEFIEIYIQGEGLCAKGIVEVTDWTKISSLRRKTSGYRGARLKDFKMEIITDSASVGFLYKDIGCIVD